MMSGINKHQNDQYGGKYLGFKTKCVTQTTGMSRTRYSDIIVYPTYYHVTNLVGLTDYGCIWK